MAIPRPGSFDAKLGSVTRDAGAVCSAVHQGEGARSPANPGAVGEEVAPVDREHRGRPQGFRGSDERSVGKVHRVVTVSVHQLERPHERSVGEEPDRDSAGPHECTQGAGAAAPGSSRCIASVSTGTVVTRRVRMVRRTRRASSCASSLGSKSATSGPVSTRITGDVSTGGPPGVPVLRVGRVRALGRQAPDRSRSRPRTAPHDLRRAPPDAPPGGRASAPQTPTGP